MMSPRAAVFALLRPFAVGAALLTALPLAACTLSVRWELQPPYGVRTTDGERTGYYTEAVGEALSRMGCTMQLREMPWARGLAELEAGRLDLMPGMLANRERRRFAHFSRRINFSPNLLFLTGAAAARHPLPTLAALRDTDLRIAVETGAYYSSEYVALLRDPRFAERLVWVPERERAWRMLATGRIDGLVSDQARALSAGVPLTPQPGDVRAVLQLSAEPVLVGLSRRTIDEAFVARFNAALETMIADGSLVRLRERFVPCPTDPATLGCVAAGVADAASSDAMPEASR